MFERVDQGLANKYFTGKHPGGDWEKNTVTENHCDNGSGSDCLYRCLWHSQN